MSSKVLPVAAAKLYSDELKTEEPPEVSHPEDIDGVAAEKAAEKAPVSLAKPDNENNDSGSVRFEEDEETKPKLNFKSAAAILRKNSNDDIGNAADLLHPSSARERSSSGLDEPDFWDKMSQYSVRMRRDGRYFFQHPYARLLVAYLVTLCNFLIYAEDPVAHSSAEANIPVVGNIYSFIVTKYPRNGWSVLKVFLWLIAVVTGCIFGKMVVHKILLKRVIKLEMFRDDNGSFMIMFLTTVLFLFAFSWLYNALLLIGGEATEPYAINGYMNMKNSTFMKAAACGTWLGDFFTAWMVTDVMLQEKFYPEWARGARRHWGRIRIALFWSALLLATFIVILVIATDWIRWDDIQLNVLATNELSRAFLASFILVMDLLIVMQDWDFPHFINPFDIKLPGLNSPHIKIKIPHFLKRFDKITIHITGVWFNYGIIFLVMLLDINMWKNQIFYAPEDYAQYVDNRSFIYSYRSSDLYLKAEGGNISLADLYDKRDRMESKYFGFSLPVKAIAFIPALSGFITFITLIIIYGREKPTKSKPYGERVVKVPKSSKKPGFNMFTIVKMKFLRRNKNDATDIEETDGQHRVIVNEDNTVSI